MPNIVDDVMDIRESGDIVDVAIMCMEESELEKAEQEIPVDTSLEDDDVVDCDDIDEEDDDASLLGSDAADYISAANDIGVDDMEDDDLIDLVASTEE